MFWYSVCVSLVFSCCWPCYINLYVYLFVVITIVNVTPISGYMFTDRLIDWLLIYVHVCDCACCSVLYTSLHLTSVLPFLIL